MGTQQYKRVSFVMARESIGFWQFQEQASSWYDLTCK